MLLQNGKRVTDVMAMVNEPKRPARRPTNVTPPLVPGGTSLNAREVIRRGRPLASIPSSDEYVSAATAA